MQQDDRKSDERSVGKRRIFVLGSGGGYYGEGSLEVCGRREKVILNPWIERNQTEHSNLKKKLQKTIEEVNRVKNKRTELKKVVMTRKKLLESKSAKVTWIL